MRRLRISHIARGTSVVHQRLFALARQPVFITVSILLHSTILAAGFTFFKVESGVNPRVQSFFDALYWAVCTITTVGYGDVVPMTVSGRVLAMALMILGTLFLVIYTALFASALVAPELRDVESDVRRMKTNVRHLEHEVGLDHREIHELVARLQALLAQK